MRNCLKVTLKKYYHKEGNRIVFQNGMSLNQLAMAMWEGLGFKSVDPSVVSRVINGKRLFTPAQLRIFCQILDIPQDKRNLLFSALSDDVIWRFVDDNYCQYPAIFDGFKLSSPVKMSKAYLPFEKLSKKSLTLFRKLTALLIPPENSPSRIQIPFSQKSYYSLLDYTLHHRHRLLDPKFAGFKVPLPVCSFPQTVIGLDNNCCCGYHLFLYGVICRAFHCQIFSRNLIQQEINRWTNFLFPMQAIVSYLKNFNNIPSHHQLLDELAIS